MKAIVVRQPWATLIALGIKTIETRPAPPNGPMRPDGVKGLPGLPLERGERIAIVAGAAKPAHGWMGGQYVWAVGERTIGAARHADDADGECPCPDPDDGVWSDACRAINTWELALLHDEGAHGMSEVAPLPLGAVVCTVRVDDALPIVAECRPGDHIAPGVGSAVPWVCMDEGNEHHYLDIDGPLGDFTPGRWGWMLSDPQPCDPIPCKGRQGVFKLPADVSREVLVPGMGGEG